MDFSLSEEQKAVRDTFARFTDQQVAPVASELDGRHEFPRELFAKLAGLGFFGLRYPESVGGVGAGLQTYCLAIEEISRGWLSLAGCAAMQSLMGTHFLYLLGSGEIHERLLKPALLGQKLGTICMTEPGAGSDLGAIATVAEQVEGGYALSGQKTWITQAPNADFFTVFAKAGPEKKLSIFLVEKGFDGLTIGKPIEKMGTWGLPTSEVFFDRCFVPEGNVLSEEIGDGERHLRTILDEIRIVTAAMALGVGRAALAEALRYAAERQQFGKPINRFQAIQLKLAEMGTELEAAEHMIQHAAWLKDTGQPLRAGSAMTKLFASEAAAAVCDKAARILGSYGYSMEYPVQRYLRDVRFTLIGGGTSEILKLIIAKELAS